MGESRRRKQMGQQMNVNINANTLKDRVCSKCGGMVFTHALTLKEMPPLLSPSGKYETMMLPVGFVCVGCGTVMSMRPGEPKEEKPKIVLVKQ
jgi:hypothetical protein